MENDTINREASDSDKGRILQKLRAVDRLLDFHLESNDVMHFFCTIEYKEDKYEKFITKEGVYKNYEQNKDYKEGTVFTFNSEEVYKTITSFLDVWIEEKLSKSIQFGFYTNAVYGNEYKTGILKDIMQDKVEIPLLESLKLHNYKEKGVFNLLVRACCKAYEKIYSNHKEKGNSDIIREFSDDDWDIFFKSITWEFDSIVDNELKDRIKTKIRKSRYFDSNLYNQEEFIMARLENLIEESQFASDMAGRFVHVSQVNQVFLEISRGVNLKVDKAYEDWDNLPEPTDKRNIIEKIKAVCPTYGDRNIGKISRRVSAGRSEHKNVDERESKSYQYRVYEACDDVIDKYLVEKNKEIDEDTINNVFKQLKCYSEEYLKDKSRDYRYCFKNSDVLEKTILILYDSCFLSFEKGENNG
ncbi:hypothetical protein IAI10_13270 [Clostridium sp. 19966]|uniref:hypothetical protein n=1 Tax=Clostridium sp. 19966 TaxID=2768166 RepID=UPI0028E00F47|nr:hypothetical protein [Clostridium sp. 19966]MDT8717637.1 hypothetical protein [Clostridium sp. 19966]